ncbi:hypothetical protein CDL15_Pgr026648 [Punica granatum]|uniref:Uncharacterized protein n=1 Tax=Punica granatum TaxID=22663 RepID=A0A218WM52_PUNGR|nr:hypothetical protein CDL15_Pgr026648 [Punica granatum]
MAIMSSSSSSSFYVSAPTSPEKHLLNVLLLYSHEPETNPPTPTCHEETGSSLDGFEFETSRRFCYVEDEPREGGGQVVAFADELFSGGKVLPLKPPPKMETSKGSGRSSPRTLSRRSLWNDDFDPFEAALMNVRKHEYQRGRRSGECLKRRARSLSPFRSSVLDEPCDAGSSWMDRDMKKPLGCTSLSREHMGLTGPKEKAVRSPKKMIRPRGVEFARRVRLVRSRNGGEVEDEGSINEEKESNRRQKSKKLPLKSSKPMTGKSESRNEKKIEISGRSNEKRRLSKMVKMAIVHYRPRKPIEEAKQDNTDRIRCSCICKT